MAAIVYLDADDEITSAASRIRIADDKRIALVVPYGSRLATSRINFRLLAREAQARGHRLSVVAGDAATRALAASAGLPVFGSVGEYEEVETARPGTDPDGVAPGAVATAPPVPRGRPPSGGNGAGPAAADDEAAALAAAPVAGAGTVAGAAPSRDVEATQGVGAATPSSDDRRSRRGTAAAGATAGAGATASAAAGAAAGTRTIAWRGRPIAWPYGQAGAIIAAGLVGLLLLALAVGAYVLLPSARATVALQLERIGPLPMEIRADPEASAPNAATGVIPAQRLTFDVAASGVFPATGRRIEQTRAQGVVRFLSKNPVDENNIGAGAIVSTPNGIQFKTTQRITIPKATIVGLTVVPGEATVSVVAVEPGPEGNVGSQAITVIPSNEDPTFTEVRNPEPTRGGSRREFPVVEQADVDAARAQLEAQLETELAAVLADPGRVPPGLTLFGQSGRIDDVLPTTDPAALVGQEIAEFPLGLAATGSVIAVDSRPVESVAAERIADSVASGYRLVDGSVVVTPGEPIVSGETVTFPVSATAAQIKTVDANTLRAEIKGKRVAEARSILDGYGEVELSVWPDWVSTIPTIDSRLEVRVELPPEVRPPAGSASPSPRATPPSAAPTSPAPSGSRPAPPAASGAAPSGSPPGLGGESPAP